jgi:hypothetical protein
MDHAPTPAPVPIRCCNAVRVLGRITRSVNVKGVT